MSVQSARSGPSTDPGTRGQVPAARLDLDTHEEQTDDDSFDDFDIAQATAEATVEKYIDRQQTVAHNIVGAAITLGLAVIMLILMAIVAGYFVQEAPSNGAFTNAINQVESVGGTAFILLAVSLLAVPVVAIVAYFSRSGLGGFLRGGGGMR